VQIIPPPQTVPLRSGQNFAPTKPLIDLARKSGGDTTPVNSLCKAFQEKFNYYNKHEEITWNEIYSVAQLIDLFIQGKQRLQRNPASGLWLVRPTQNEAVEKRVISLMRFYEQMLVAKWQLSNPDITIYPGSDADQAALAAKAGTSIWNFYEEKFYTSEFSQKEVGQALRNGTYLHYYGYDDAQQSAVALRSIMENKNISIGGGMGWCGECDTQGKAEMFEPDTESPIPSFKCPNCGSSSTKVYPPEQLENVQTIGGQEQVSQGELVCRLWPLQACKWDLMGKAEESDWLLHQQHVSLAQIRALLGNLKLEGDSTNTGLDILEKLAYTGLAISGHAQGGDRKPKVYKDPVKVEEMYLSASDLWDIKLQSEEETVSGQKIPAGKRLSEVFPNGCLVTGLNNMSVIIGLYAESHKDHVVSAFWHGNPNSGAGQGVGDAIEVAKQYTTMSSQMLRGVQTQTTPGLVFIDGTIDEEKVRYLGVPTTAVPVKLQGIPENLRSIDKLVGPAFPASSLPAEMMQRVKDFFNELLQLTMGVTEFSGGLPGQAGQNDTATGAQIEQAVSQSLSTPKLQGKAFVRLQGAKITINNWRKFMPIRRPIPVPGKFGRTNFKFFSAADIQTELIFRAVPNSEIAKTIYDVRRDLDGFYALFGGYMGYLQAKQVDPKAVMEEARRRGIQLEDEDWDNVAGLCLTRLDQMKQGLRQTQDPQGLLEFIQPPISQFESYLDLQRKWFQDWLIWDEGREAEQQLRMAVELIIQGNFAGATQQDAAMGLRQGVVQAATQAPAALGQQMLEQNQPQDNSQMQGEEASRQHEAEQAAQEQQAQLQSQQMQQQHEAQEGAEQRAHEQGQQQNELAMRAAEMANQEKVARMKGAAK
jgi:hypothetical protein